MKTTLRALEVMCLLGVMDLVWGVVIELLIELVI